jgi:hypothetical protein
MLVLVLLVLGAAQLLPMAAFDQLLLGAACAAGRVLLGLAPAPKLAADCQLLPPLAPAAPPTPSAAPLPTAADQEDMLLLLLLPRPLLVAAAPLEAVLIGVLGAVPPPPAPTPLVAAAAAARSVTPRFSCTASSIPRMASMQAANCWLLSVGATSSGHSMGSTSCAATSVP